MWTEPACFARPTISTVAANAISDCTIRSRSDDPDQPGPYTPRARATVPVNASSLPSARKWTLGGRRIPRFLFLLTAREVYACASAPAVPELAPTRRADHFLAAGPRICVRRRQNRRLAGGAKWRQNRRNCVCLKPALTNRAQTAFNAVEVIQILTPVGRYVVGLNFWPSVVSSGSLQIAALKGRR